MARSPFQSSHDATLPAMRSAAVRWWLTAGVIGLLVILALPALADAWQVNQAGILLNRYQATQDAALLDQAASLLGTPQGPHSASYWRTLGAIATLRPTQAAYDALNGAHNRDELDRIGELWLGEVASATGHWEEANDAYARVDATNVLVERGDEALQAGNANEALHWYAAAARSESAQMEREAAALADLRSPGALAAPLSDSEDEPGNRAVSLLRIGRGLLSVEHPEEALPVLELAYTQMLDHPPGTREQQAIRFSLATAFLDQARKDAINDTGDPLLPPAVRDRVETLAADALAVDATALAHLQAADLHARLGNTPTAAAHYVEAIRLDPRLPDAYLRLAEIQREAGFPWLARGTLARGHAALPTDPVLAVAWAIEGYRTLPPRKALPNLEKAAGTETRDPYLFAYLGDTYRELGRLEDALNAYSEGLRRSPGAPPLESRLSHLVSQMEGWPLP